jgi:glycosyltransferase involved in cell wall biosynthesis
LGLGVATDVRQASAGQADDVLLTVPADDVADPELSIVIPALDEELTIGPFIDWCKEGLRRAGVAGEVLIVDSSSDRTAEIALARGARVLKTPRRGLGRAYIDALPYIRGRYVLMGDADCTYDFRDVAPFVERMREGYEFVMGSRRKGYIQPGSMPPHHRYLGTPLTTWVLNRLYSSRFTDIHCGMRGITRDALERMGLQSQSWEYASEMVLKSVHMGLQTAEVPVRFLKDPEGRESHHKRAGWLSPFKAAWINLRAMFVYGSDFFVFKPGIVLAVVGLAILFPVTFGDIDIGPLTLSLNWQLLGLALYVIGLQAFFLGCVAQVLFDYTGRRTERWLRVFPYTRSVLLAVALVLAGIGLAVPLVVSYFDNGFKLSAANSHENHLAVTGVAAAISGAQLFISTLLLHATVTATRQRRRAASA